MPTPAEIREIRANRLAAQQKAAAAKAAAAKAAVPVKTSSGMGKPAPSPAPVPVKTSSGMGKPAPAPAPAPVQNPKIQIDQGYGNGIGYDGKPLYPDIRSAIGNAANPIKNTPLANATGPMTPVRGGGMAPASVATMMKKGGKVKSKSSYSSGGGVKSTASKRGDGIAQRGKTKGRMI